MIAELNPYAAVHKLAVTAWRSGGREAADAAIRAFIAEGGFTGVRIHRDHDVDVAAILLNAERVIDNPPDEFEDEDEAAITPFPLEVLPKAAEDYARILVEDGLPIEFVAPSILGAIATAVGGLKKLEIKKGRWAPVRASLWILNIGEPGTGKSPALRHAKAPLVAAEIQYQNQWQRETEFYDVLPAKEKKDQARPLRKRLLASNFTVEALIGLLHDNPPGIACFADELAGLLNGLGQFKVTGGNDRQTLLSMWSSDGVSLDRVTHSKDVPAPVLPIVGCVQLAKLELVMEGGDGLRERFLPSHYTGDIQPPKPLDFDAADTGLEYAALIERILAHRNSPNIRTLDAAGRVRFAKLRQRKYDLTLTARASSPHIELWLGKMEAQVLSIALILAEVDDPVGLTVPVEAIDRAERIFDYYLDQVRRLPYYAKNLLATRPEDHDHTRGADQLGTWLRRRSDHRASLRDIRRAKVAGVRSAADTARLAAKYEELNPGHMVKEKNASTGQFKIGIVLYAPGYAPSKDA